VLLAIGIGLAVLRQQPGLAIFASIVWLLGVLMFLAQLLRLVGGRNAAPAVAPAE
jgi:phosphotransferase system  glucose/maltose/N-acetylglucosamine-specific IIC component